MQSKRKHNVYFAPGGLTDNSLRQTIGLFHPENVKRTQIGTIALSNDKEYEEAKKLISSRKAFLTEQLNRKPTHAFFNLFSGKNDQLDRENPLYQKELNALANLRLVNFGDQQSRATHFANNTNNRMNIVGHGTSGMDKVQSLTYGKELGWGPGDNKAQPTGGAEKRASDFVPKIMSMGFDNTNLNTIRLTSCKSALESKTGMGDSLLDSVVDQRKQHGLNARVTGYLGESIWGTKDNPTVRMNSQIVARKNAAKKIP